MLQEPFNHFCIDIKAGGYKDFRLTEDNPYSLKGMTNPVDYRDIPGYVGEDGYVYLGK
jgi:hypothetical protein